MLSIEHLSELAQKHSAALSSRVQEFALKGRLISSNAHKSIMGVINLSAELVVPRKRLPYN